MPLTFIAGGSIFEIRAKGASAGFFIGIDIETREGLLDSLASVDDAKMPSIPPESGRHRDRESL